MRLQVHIHGLDLDFLAFGLALGMTFLLILGTHETSLFNLGAKPYLALIILGCAAAYAFACYSILVLPFIQVLLIPLHRCQKGVVPMQW